MTSSATAVREAIVTRLTGLDWLPVRTVRRQPRPQLQEKDLPALFVVVADEVETPDGDANSGPPRFVADLTIGISVVIGEELPEDLDADLDDLIDRIRSHLLCDPTFVRGVDPAFPKGHPDRDPLFEAVTRVRRGRLFPQEGASYTAEGRLEISFQLRTQYDPVLTDPYLKTVLTARPAGAGTPTPAISIVIDHADE